MNYMKILKNDMGFNVPKIYWNYTTKKILTLDKVEWGINKRAGSKLKELGVDLKKPCRKFNSIFFKTSSQRWFFSW